MFNRVTWHLSLPPSPQDGGGPVGPDGAAALPDQQEDPARGAVAARARAALAAAPRVRQAAARLEGAALRVALEERQGSANLYAPTHALRIVK